MVRDLWTIKTYTFNQGQSRSINFIVHVDAGIFDGNDEQAEEAIRQTIEYFETSLRAKVTEHRSKKWELGIKPPRPLTRKLSE